MSDEMANATEASRSGDDAKKSVLAIWHASVDAVRAKTLINRTVKLRGEMLSVEAHDGQAHTIDLGKFRRVCIVGGGKAVAGMAAAMESKLAQSFNQPGQLFGFVNIPTGTSEPARYLTMHEARPLGVNEPTIAAIEGTERILELVGSLRQDDLCIVLLTGGGSALLPAPIEGLTLDHKVEVTRFLSAAGADVVELNAVRRQLSRVKGGRLAAACGAGHILSLVISDVLSDDLASIASGPTVARDDRDAALAALEKFDRQRENVLPLVWETIEGGRSNSTVCISPAVENVILANNETAVLAASAEADRRGFHIETIPTQTAQPTADALGRELAERYRCLAQQRVHGAIISGGEPTVQLAPVAERGKGGRNQQAVLAAMIELAKSDDCEPGMWILSGGTDGEDGPTDAAGAVAGPPQIALIRRALPEAIDALAANNAYPLLERIGAIFKTGLTGTNVCDVQVVLSARP